MILVALCRIDSKGWALGKRPCVRAGEMSSWLSLPGQAGGGDKGVNVEYITYSCFKRMHASSFFFQLAS